MSTFFILFLLTLTSAVIAKTSFLLMINGIGWGNKNMSICTDKIPGKFFFLTPDKKIGLFVLFVQNLVLNQFQFSVSFVKKKKTLTGN